MSSGWRKRDLEMLGKSLEMHTKYFWCTVLLLLCTACMSPDARVVEGNKAEIFREAFLQREMILKQKLKEEAHIQRIAYEIWQVNAELCPKTRYDLGFRVWSLFSFPEKDEQFIAEVLNLTDQLEVREVFKGSAAEKAGLQAGDVLLAVGSETLPASNKARSKLRKALKAHEARFPVLLHVMRADQQHKIKITPELVCHYPVIFQFDDRDINATATGEKVNYNLGMYQFAENDLEIALILAHELGHNVMNHIPKGQINALTGQAAGFALDIIAQAGGYDTNWSMTQIGKGLGFLRYKVAFEQEADYVGMYFIARAGHDTEEAAYIWRRMTMEVLRFVNETRITHPLHHERVLALEGTHREIVQKLDRGEPLVPNFKSLRRQPRPQGDPRPISLIDLLKENENIFKRI
jgi:hypothetical protein